MRFRPPCKAAPGNIRKLCVNDTVHVPRTPAIALNSPLLPVSSQCYVGEMSARKAPSTRTSLYVCSQKIKESELDDKDVAIERSSRDAIMDEPQAGKQDKEVAESVEKALVDSVVQPDSQIHANRRHRCQYQ